MRLEPANLAFNIRDVQTRTALVHVGFKKSTPMSSMSLMLVLKHKSSFAQISQKKSYSNNGGKEVSTKRCKQVILVDFKKSKK